MSNESSSFTPVPRHNERHDGWSADKQRDFIDALADYGIVRAAAQKVGMGAASAYRLRCCEGAESFASAWDAALRIGMASLQDVAMDRAINGVAVPRFYKGEQVGETRRYNDRLLMFMLRQTNTRRYGPHAWEWDFVDETLAVEAAREAKRVEMLEKAEALANSMTEMISEMNRLDAEERDKDMYDDLIAKRDRLEETCEQLRAANPVDTAQRMLTAADFRGYKSPGTLAKMNRRWRGAGP